jgi:hypothetical protein
VDNSPGYLIHDCVTLSQEIRPESCPTKPLSEAASE